MIYDLLNFTKSIMRRKKKLLKKGFIYGSNKKYMIMSTGAIITLKWQSKTIQIQKEVPFEVMEIKKIRNERFLYFKDE